MAAARMDFWNDSRHDHAQYPNAHLFCIEELAAEHNLGLTIYARIDTKKAPAVLTPQKRLDRTRFERECQCCSIGRICFGSIAWLVVCIIKDVTSQKIRPCCGNPLTF